MKRFSFNLETVLRYRARKEEEAVFEQAVAEARRRRKEEDLAATRATLHECLGKGPDAGSAVAYLLHASVYHVHLNRLADRQATEADEAAREWAVCRERTMIQHRERQVLEKLKERKMAEFHYLVAVQEQKENDEISLRLHTVRNNRR
ncbi:MAG: flagellar export protein FliJ [Peptococcaceae bacterium]|jgi:flagellar export protein FliJ|nr:flagellar export protein FliJ [Peptococcaceae bacterium]